MKPLSPFENRSLLNLENETWVNVFGFKGEYSVSNMGRVRSNERLSKANHLIQTRILKQKVYQRKCIASINETGVSPSVPVIVVTSFLNKPYSDVVPPNHKIHHLDLDITNNRLNNLKIMSNKDIGLHLFKAGIITSEQISDMNAMAVKLKSDNLNSLNVYCSGELIARICSKCFLEKPISEYKNGAKNISYCYDCKLRQGGVKNVGLKEKRLELKVAGLKKCWGCDNIVSIAFCVKNGLCKTCLKNRNAVAYQKRKNVFCI